MGIIFNLILNNGIFSIMWKTSKVIPVFKKGDLSDIENYMPISLISNFSKVIYAHISNIPAQHTFGSSKSTVSNQGLYYSTPMNSTGCKESSQHHLY